jgi:hypothetical protein
MKVGGKPASLRKIQGRLEALINNAHRVINLFTLGGNITPVHSYSGSTNILKQTFK